MRRSPILSLASSWDGSMFFTGAQDGTIHAWDVDTRQMLHSFGPVRGTHARRRRSRPFVTHTMFSRRVSVSSSLSISLPALPLP